MGGATFATGGSATSQADDSRTWKPNRAIAWSIRIATWITPVLVSFAAARTYALLVDPDVIGRPAFWGGLFALTICVAMVVERRMRTFVPLAALFNLSLVFPDQAPNRFGVALRSRTARKLKVVADEHGDTDPATRLLELVRELGEHDPLTRGHSERVRAYADLIAEEMGLSQDDRDRLAWGALAHDVGKLDVRASTLNKNGRPDADEWEEIRGHPGAAIHRMAPLQDWLGDWALAASQHHERWDGGGYPLGLKGEEISLAGRIVAVADAYDVMTSARSYKKGLSAEAARSELINNAETQFDPEVVRAFLNAGLKPIRTAGPLAWLSELAWLARVPQAASVAGSSAASTAATAAVSVATVIGSPLTPTAIDIPDRRELAIERTVEEVVEATAGVDEPIEIVPEATSTLAPPTSTTVVTTSVPPTTTASEPEAGSVGTQPDTTTSAPSVPASTTTLLDLPTTSTTPIASTTTSVAPGPSVPTTSTTPPNVPSSTIPPTTSAAATGPPSTNAASSGFSTLVHLEATVGSGNGTVVSRLDGSLSDGDLPNYDHRRDDDPGLTVKRGSGFDETDPDRRHRFWDKAEMITALLGTPELDIWVSTRDHDTAKSGVVLVSLQDCAASKTDCVTIATGSVGFEQADFGAGFGQVTVELTPVDHELAPSRSVMLNVMVGEESEDDLWFAYGTTAYPASFRITPG